ncbi:uncharacterized protein [Pagrus major]|uniref:uncharacterized protein n=1 Tax=Pagrus major TaxID=143350 RepID=UPI003CC889E8
MEALKEALEKGRALADELAAKAPIPPRKRKRAEGSNVTWRRWDQDGNIIPQRVRKNRSQSVKPSSSRELPRVEELPVHADEIPQEVPNLDQLIQTLRDLLSSVPASTEDTPTTSSWARRQSAAQKNFRAAMPQLLNYKLAAETVEKHCCYLCKAADAVVRCLDCVPSGTQFLCPDCDSKVHKKMVFHDREAMMYGFFKPIPPTSSVVMDQSGQHQLVEQVCILPIPPPLQVCSCGTDQDFTIVPGKQTVLVTINGPYNLCLPVVCCPHCKYKWTPGINDLLGCRYWPATTSCQLLFKFDVFTSFEEMKLASPALSQQAFLRMLVHRSLSTGRMGSICGDSFHKSFREFAYCKFKENELCQVEPFVCPACTPDMLAVSADGNRKHYRFRKSKGTDEPSVYDGVFIAPDAQVSAFVDSLRSQMTVRTGHDACGPATFTAARETANKSRAKVDEEGLEIAVCRHGSLLKALNHYRGEIYAYPMFLQKELTEKANVTFFCMDITCRYWPYMKKMAEKLPELQPLTEMKPFLSVMHAKAHTGKCEVRWGGRNQEGAGNTIGEEVEQVNSFLSRAALTTKYMTKSGRADMITVLAMAWNHRKHESLHKTLTQRFVKATQRAEVEAANLQHLKQELNISLEDTEQWVDDVKQWAASERPTADSTQEELQREIENMIYSIRKKKNDLYRQNDSNKTRQRKRRRLAEVKKKLKETVIQYNAEPAFEPKIDIEAVCSLSDNVILPWDVQGDVVSLRLKRRLFDQVMLVRRMEEERLIIVKEMTQHCQYLRNALDKLDNLLHQVDHDIKNHDMTEEGYRGLHCCLLHKRYLLHEKLSRVTSTYALVAASSSFSPFEEEEEGKEKEEEESEQDISSSDEEL